MILAQSARAIAIEQMDCAKRQLSAVAELFLRDRADQQVIDDATRAVELAREALAQVRT